MPFSKPLIATRRSFLKVGSAGLVGLTLTDVLRQEAAATSKPTQKPADSVILIWLAGGPATIDMWDLKPDAPEEIRGEFQSIETSAPGIRISEHLSRIAKIMHQATLVRSLHHSIPAHGPGAQYMLTGNRPNPALEYPSLGSLASGLLPSSSPGVPAYVAFNRNRYDGAGHLGAAHNPFAVSTSRRGFQVEGVSLPDGFTAGDLQTGVKLRNRFDQRFRQLDNSDLPASLNKFQQQALDILRSDKIRKAFEVSEEPKTILDRYGRSPLARSALAARRLIQAGARFVTVGLGGWDTHAANFNALQNRLLPPVDQTLSALITDLDEKGMLQRTIVYCAGEFGRTPRINRLAGRDHWARSMSVLLAGGGYPKGFVYGETDREGMVPKTRPCSPDDIAATIFQRLGIAPHHEARALTGRPIPIFREGQAIRQLAG